jgi:ferredoxin
MEKPGHDPKVNRRKFLFAGIRASILAGIGGIAALGVKKSAKAEQVWQLDPAKCVQCGRCATSCVLTPSAVKCVHVYAMCGYCDLCGGYFKPETKTLNTGAENQLCPTSAIKRKFIEDPFFEYTIDEPLCIGCGKCVKGCGSFGNGSLQLQVRHNICVNCNQCAIARDCPADAFSRVPANKPYLLRQVEGEKTIAAKTSPPLLFFLLTLLLSIQFLTASAVQRFPKPEFETGYVQPETLQPSARAEILAVMDVFVLIGSLALVTWLVLKKRSRIGVFWASLFSLAYYGFYREGCICSIGAIQNVTLAIFDTGYVIPITAIAFFILPLIFTLFFGRTFCAGVCPFGAMQDLVSFRPQKLGPRLNAVLGLIPYIYLGLAILYAATKTDFIICRYDPFVGVFRFNASFGMFIFAGTLLISGIFIARPYCRFLCPYGVLLNWISRYSWKHLTITPSQCIQCRLCEDSCPYDAIDIPVTEKNPVSKPAMIRKLILICFLVPFFTLLGGWTTSQMHETLAGVNGKIRLAKTILEPEKTGNIPESLEMTAYKSSGKPVSQVFSEVSVILNQFNTGSWILGCFLGLVFGITLARHLVNRHQIDYTPNKGTCFSCARCLDFCPVTLNDEKTNI